MIPFIDPEWQEAEQKNEEARYYRCEMGNGGYRINLYKPSIAKLVAYRTGLRVEPLTPYKEKKR